MKSTDLLIIGAGPAGLMAGIHAADLGMQVIILESMPRPARKLGISGKGRGNLTNTAPFNDFLKHFNNQGRFLKSAFKTFFNTELVEFFNREGLETVEERGGRVFVASGKATDAIACLHKAIEKRKVQLLTSKPVTSLMVEKDQCLGAMAGGRPYLAGATLLATGGLSYPGTGSTGDGLAFARACGHEIVTTLPSLVALTPAAPLPEYLNEISLRNVSAELRVNGKKIAAEFGEMTFLDGNLAGPIIITLSRLAVPAIHQGHLCEIVVDLKPALDHAKLDRRILRDFEEKHQGSLAEVIPGLLPAGMRQFCMQQLDLSPALRIAKVTAEQRRALRNWLKELKFTVSGHAPWEQAIVTAGGVSTRQINPATLESKLIKNLYFAGEIIDIDADTGGYNLQAAFSTGWLAADSIAGSHQPQP
ncbi:MAG TPA: NAD(P)/FAD-dependent oxidoreductase [Candidatus Rifleibacterium sp.]|nr:NAD(P)/FAD-dependent oxidoreductase [Candidatus Rifleibacterium sp.]HPT45930.1 NAD(P)/FAD-dependent oxidoreductase [Candidatus Rifleibacterium sp.]